MDSDGRVRVGIVGLGGIGHHHADRLRDGPGVLAGGMDVDDEARSQFAGAYDVKTYADVSELYEHVDAVFVTTPNRFHEKYAISALEAGLDVLLEKPLAHTLESAERIAEAANEAPGICMVGFNNRFAAPVQVLKKHQVQGRLGETTHIEANFVRRRGIPGRGSWFTTEEVSGGGALIDIGVHAVDLSLYFLDFPEIVEVSGAARSEFGSDEEYSFLDMWGEDVGPEGFDVDDSASAFVRSAEGQTVTLEVAWATNRPPNNDFFVRGTDGGARLDKGNHELTLYGSGIDGVNYLTNTTVDTRDIDTHRAEQAAFLSAVESREPPERNTVEEALAVQRVIDAIYRSSEAGRAVRLDE